MAIGPGIMADEFTCRSCGPLPRTAFNAAILSCRKAGDCKACRSAANKRHYAANKWRLRATIAPGAAGVHDAAGLAADVIARHGRRCAITGTVDKPLVVVKLAGGELVPILRRLLACGVAPGGVLQQTPPYLESPATPPATPPAPAPTPTAPAPAQALAPTPPSSPAPPAAAALDGDAGGDTGTVDAVNSAESPPSHAPPAVPDAPRPVPTVADRAPPTSADGAPVRASAPVSGLLAERLKSMKETKAVAGLMTKGGTPV